MYGLKTQKSTQACFKLAITRTECHSNNPTDMSDLDKLQTLSCISICTRLKSASKHLVHVLTKFKVNTKDTKIKLTDLVQVALGTFNSFVRFYVFLTPNAHLFVGCLTKLFVR